MSTDVPPGWGKWSIDDAQRGQLEWVDAGGRAEPRCVRITGVRNGCFIQPIPVTPGETYVAGAWTAEASDVFAAAPSGLDGWRKTSVVVTVPEGAE